MKTGKNKNFRSGAALLVVLFIVMVVTVLSLGFISQSDVELACGQNMILRTQMDYLAESGLEHAKGLILNPQDVSTEYFTEATNQQLVAGSNDYYSMNVTRDESDQCNYIIDCNSYRLKNGEEVGRSNIRAELRLDPCITFWAGTSTVINSRTSIKGDVYCAGNVLIYGDVDGDVFSGGIITGVNPEGKENENIDEPPLEWPGINISDFSSDYYIGSNNYQVENIESGILPTDNFNPSENNPAGVLYYNGNLELNGNIGIQGMLVVDGGLKISGENNCIKSVKDFPALVVKDEVVIENGAELEIEGLVQIGQKIVIDPSVADMNINIKGGLFIANGGIDGIIPSTSFINIIAAPTKTAIQIWPTAGTPKRWGQAAGAFYRSIEKH